LIAVDAAASDPSSTVTVEPTRILDTRTMVGLDGPPAPGTSETLQVTGIVPTQPSGGAAAVDAEVVPVGATAVILNATVVGPVTKGFLSVRPGDATGIPATSNINWDAGGANIANSVTVQLPPSGDVDVFVNGTVAHVLIDVAGYMVPATSGPAGPEGPVGPVGPEGPVGPVGPSNAYATTTAIGNPTDDAFAPVMTLDVPAGSYVVSASLYGIPDFAEGDEVRSLLCDIRVGDEQADFLRATTAQQSVHAIIALEGAATLDAPGVISVNCLAGGTASEPFDLFGTSLVALQVGSLTTSS
jgi:hypothetical protein